jgi:D-lactate dehydrogenase
VILEDVVFPVEKLANAVRDLRLLFTQHGYENAIIFGHAKDGNLHFVITQSFNEQKEIDRNARLMDDVVSLVVERYDGLLKVEHGTGRNMAPFVEAEWGSEATEIMRQLKALVDPENLLNPDVIINSDPRAHVNNLKTLPSVEDEVDKCIECGYCEVMCPSRDLTLTPRQRIVVRREMKRLASDAAGSPEIVASLDADFPYMALDTCAVDGLCALACPVRIDTGALTKRLRRERHSPSAQRGALLLAQNLAWVERTARLMLRTGHVAESLIGPRIVNLITRWARVLSRQRLPLWTDDLPHAASTRFPGRIQHPHTRFISRVVFHALWGFCLTRLPTYHSWKRSLRWDVVRVSPFLYRTIYEALAAESHFRQRVTIKRINSQ